MKLFTFILSGVVLAQSQEQPIEVVQKGGRVNTIETAPGTCKYLGILPVTSLYIPEGLALQFYDGTDCTGAKVATGYQSRLIPKFDPSYIRSAKVITQQQFHDTVIDTIKTDKSGYKPSPKFGKYGSSAEYYSIYDNGYVPRLAWN